MLLCSPAARALKKNYPEAEIHVASEPLPAEVWRGNPYVDRVVIFPGRKASFREQAAFFLELRKNRYDWVFDFLGNPRSAWMTLASGAPVRVGFAFRVRRWVYTHPVLPNRVRRYQGEVNLLLLRRLGISDDGAHPDLFLEEGETKWARRILAQAGFFEKKPLVAFNVSGSWSAKRWPRGNWRRLLELWRAEKRPPVLLLWGPGDEERVEWIREGLEETVRAAPPLSLRNLAAVIRHVDLLVGNDGAPQHFAQALGVPTLTLFGPTWGLSWCLPADRRHVFLQHFLDCGPCDRTVCPHAQRASVSGYRERECLLRLSPKEVLQKVKCLLKEVAGG